MTDFSSMSVSELQSYLSSPPCTELFRLVEMIDAGNMHGYDFSSDPETADLARQAGLAGYVLAGKLLEQNRLAEARLVLMNSLDLCWYIFPEEEDPAWIGRMNEIEQKRASSARQAEPAEGT